jgi:large subunit ribosomal protein L18
LSSLAQKKMARLKRKVRVRKKIQGTPVCPRLNVFKSAKHIYAQIIDDVSGVTMVSASTVMKDVQSGLKYTGNLDAAVKVGAAIAEKARAKGIERVVFDRSGFLYHGRIKALADAARGNGLSF